MDDARPDHAPGSGFGGSAETPDRLGSDVPGRLEGERLGRRLAADIEDPDALVTALVAGLDRLGDPRNRSEQLRVAPDIGPTFGVRSPILAAIIRGFRDAARGERPSRLLFVADRLFREEHREPRWIAFRLLERILPDDPERAWQLLRRAAREAADWITVDALAHPYAKGILLEPYRWAELEQLVYSPSRWERRLVGSTIATTPHVDRSAGRAPIVVDRGLDLIDELIGDAEPDVQKALAWALRTLAELDGSATAGFLERAAQEAAEANDGHRARVIRASLAKIDDGTASRVRGRLAGIRRRGDAPATSRAAHTAARFTDLDRGRSLPEPPLT